MSGLQRAMRHPDRINDPHDRARRLASDGLLGPLDEGDAGWLATHLAACVPCRATADAFAADAALLRGLRAETPVMPRDLGARVSQALDREVRQAVRRAGPSRTFGVRAGSVGRGPARRPSPALAGLALTAIIAILVLPLALPLVNPPAASPGVASFAPAPTPITVDSQPVAWVRQLPDGTYVISSAEVSQVCAGMDATACGTLDGGARTLAALDVQPSSVLLPRDGKPAVIVGEGAVYAVMVNVALPVTSPGPEASPVPTSEPLQSPAASGELASPPVGSPAPSRAPASPEATEVATTASPAATLPVASPTASPASTALATTPALPTEEPSAVVASATPGDGSTPEPPTPLPTLPPATPAPTAATALAIAEGVVLTGASPAYSPDGTWVAFSARPVDGTQGPDIYVWRVGDPKASPVTTDHASVFSGWLDGSILASAARVAGSDPTSVDVPPADADPATVIARSYLVDPATGAVTAIPLDGVWRPLVDPTDRVAVFWTGTLAWSAADLAWLPATGNLMTVPWGVVRDASASPLPELLPTPTPNATPSPLADESATPTAIATASPSAVPTASPDGSPDASSLPVEAAAGNVVDWEVRFDPAGRRLGVWIADPTQPGAGHLSLVAVEEDGRLGPVVLADAAALSGFSLDADRLAWSTPPGQNGQGSLVAVFAWKGDAAGQLYSLPELGSSPLLVAR